MNWCAAIKEEKRALSGIIAVLLSLADLAEFTCNRSWAVCCLRLWILRPAETAAWELVDCRREIPQAPFDRSGDVRVDMIRLAVRLRELACILKVQADRALSAGPESSHQIGVTLLRIAHMLDIREHQYAWWALYKPRDTS